MSETLALGDTENIHIGDKKVIEKIHRLAHENDHHEEKSVVSKPQVNEKYANKNSEKKVKPTKKESIKPINRVNIDKQNKTVSNSTNSKVIVLGSEILKTTWAGFISLFIILALF